MFYFLFASIIFLLGNFSFGQVFIFFSINCKCEEMRGEFSLFKWEFILFSSQFIGILRLMRTAPLFNPTASQIKP